MEPTANPSRRQVEPTANPSRRQPERQRRWRARFGAFAAFAALVTAGIAVAPSAAYADPTGPFPRPPITAAPCSQLGPIDWFFTNQPPPYIQSGVRYIILSVTPVFEPATGRFIQNTSDQTITGTFTASESRTVSMTTTFNLSIASTAVMRTTITLTTGIQVVQSRTSMIGVTANSPIPPRSTLLGEYGINSLDIIMDVQTVAMRQDGQTCEFSESTRQRHTAHVPTINEGWRFTLS